MSLLKLLEPAGTLVSWVNFRVDRLRLAKLMSRGLKVGRNVYIMEGVDFDSGYPFLIEIGDDCRIAKGVRILAHDATTFRDLGVTRIAPVRILPGTFIAERAIILPGVTIGPRALIAAGSVVNRDIGEDALAAGNPARPYGKFSDLLARYAEKARSDPVFKKEEIEQGIVTQQDLIRTLAEHSVAFIRGTPAQDPYYVHTDFGQVQDRALRAYQRVQSEASQVGVEV